MLLLIGSVVAVGPQSVAPDQTKQNTEGLTLTLSTDKQVYLLGEQIKVTVTLRNVSSSGLWVGNAIMFADVPGAFALSVLDEQGKRIPVSTAYFAGASPDFRHQDVFDWIRKTRLVLCSGCFLGMSTSLQEYASTLNVPGKYKLQVVYSDIGYKEFQEEGANAANLKSARQRAVFPLWSGSVKSNEVWVQVAQ